MRSGKENDGIGLHLHKHKDGSVKRLFRYTIHGRRREMGLDTFKNVCFKKAVNVQHNGILFCMRVVTPFKNHW
ncbi:Arm DNA-binding domain-containing protein [Bartonella machadoae]|nr:Arm DNA-binding domain-containing protein [Bartonella machadoae]